VPIPFSVIYGAKDVLIKDKAQVDQWKDFTSSSCDFIELPECGHFLHEDKNYLQTVAQLMSKLL
jgi:pimeloyl-ACP methyl ester carboxylesterase